MRDPVRFRYRPDGRADDWEIAGWLSVPPGAGDTLLILVHGGFYTHAYWDFPYRPETYSCVLWAWERGLATLNIDRPGNGESTHPPGLDLDMPRNAEALHEVIWAVRADGVGGRQFSNIVTVGHSLGSFTAALAQADHGGADGVVLTGSIGLNMRRIADTPEAREAFARRYVLAADDPQLADRAHLYDAAYRTVPAGRRALAFYDVPPADPDLIAIDERLKGVMTAAESRSMGYAADACARIDAPVLVQVGEHDAMYYDPKRDPDLSRVYARAIAAAPPNFSFDPPYPDTGHNLALHPNAREGYERMLGWMKAQGLA